MGNLFEDGDDMILDMTSLTFQSNASPIKISNIFYVCKMERLDVGNYFSSSLRYWLCLKKSLLLIKRRKITKKSLS